jgi:glycerol uptake facilitator-like aquaporin
MVRKLFSEFLGTVFLVAVVVGSGIMAENLSGGNVAIALLGNTIATGAILVVIISVFGPISGAHFNPAVTLAFLIKGELDNKSAVLYVLLQILAGIAGTIIANLMFELPMIEASTHARTGASQWLAEFVATFGLVMTIFGCIKSKPDAVPYAVYLIHVFRQPGGDHCQNHERYILGHCARRCARFYPGTISCSGRWGMANVLAF